MEEVLRTRRLAMRRFSAGDVDGLVALDSDPEVMRFLGPVESRAEVEADVLPRLLSGHVRHPGFGYWAAQILPDEPILPDERADLAGWFGLRPVVPGSGWIDDWPEAPAGNAAVAALGYRLRRGAWGQGYATEGALALVCHAFTRLGVHRVVATTMAVNARSRRVLEKAGLTHVRTLYLDWAEPLPGAEHGDVEYELRRDDWEP